jgi:hypothetical protein
MGAGPPGHYRLQGVFQIVNSRLSSRGTEIGIEVVDAATVSDASALVDDNRSGGDKGFCV